mgnify:CR=1 FL=1|tara:strand:+ start:4825 stop:7539 length:2715 start_codon:yes stop_codon:yes gene_type:complete
MPQLVFRYDDGGEDVFALNADQIGIGRDPDNPIVINNDFVSTHHARLKREEDGAYSLFDLGSNNGTFVNDRAISSVKLNDGDVIRFGACEVSYVEDDSEQEAVQEKLKTTQRITLEALAQQSAGYWSATVENKRKELDSLERRILELEQERDEARAEATRNQGEDSARKGKELSAEISRLEEKREEVQDTLLKKSERLEELVETEIPSAKEELEGVRRDIVAAASELRDLQTRINEAKAQIENVAQLEDQTRKLQSKVDSLYREHDAKKVALGSTSDDLVRNETKLEEMRRELEEIKVAEKASVDLREEADRDHRQLVEQNTELRAAIKDNEAQLAQLAEQARIAQEKQNELEAKNDQITGQISRAEDKLLAVEAKLEGSFEGWDEFEKSQLHQIVERKNQISEECTTTEKKLVSAKNELDDVRSRIRMEAEEAEEALEDLRINHYEPTQELHEELTLRNEDLANEIAHRERHLDELRYSIQESEETERIVTHTLTSKGEALARLEQRVGEEVEKIEKAVSSRHRPVDTNNPPRKLELSRRVLGIGPPSVNGTDVNGHHRVHLTVFDPHSPVAPIDFSETGFTSIDQTPLPVGFEGLAAATGGALMTSLAQTVQLGRPVLFVPGESLEMNTSTMKKLRSAMPHQVILLGWKPETFSSMTKTLDEDAHFQDLTALMSLSDGSLTTDSYMSVFFESLIQGNRFLHLPPALPWNPRSQLRFEERMGIYIDAAEFRPENLEHQALVTELKEIVQASRQMLTVQELPEHSMKTLMDLLELGSDWITVVPEPTYKDRLSILGQHLAIVTFEVLDFHSTTLRDALLAQTLLIARETTALQTFFPEIVSGGASDHALPAPSQIVPLFEQADKFNLVMNQAERKLLDEYSYQAAARKLDQFVADLERQTAKSI